MRSSPEHWPSGWPPNSSSYTDQCLYPLLHWLRSTVPQSALTNVTNWQSLLNLFLSSLPYLDFQQCWLDLIRPSKILVKESGLTTDWVGLYCQCLYLLPTYHPLSLSGVTIYRTSGVRWITFTFQSLVSQFFCGTSAQQLCSKEKVKVMLTGNWEHFHLLASPFPL